MKLEAFKQSFDVSFRTALAKHLASARAHHPHKDIDALVNHIAKLADAGKRVRPYACAVAYGAKTWSATKPIRPVLYAIELLHLFALIHDDIIDRAKTRHGVTTFNARTEARDAIQAGNEAILMGDLLFGWSQQQFRSAQAPKDAAQVYDNLVEELIIGQTLDTLLQHRFDYARQDVMAKTMLKTARYTFARPIELGARLAKQSPAQIRRLRTFGEQLGLLFQIDDDWLDLSGNEKKLGKPAYLDIQDAQATLIGWYLLHKATPDVRTRFKRLLGKPVHATEQQEIRSIIEDSHVQTYIAAERQALIHAIKQSMRSLDESKRWEALCEILFNRTK